VSAERIQHERDRALRSLRDASSAVDVLAAFAAAVPDWLPEGSALRVDRPKGARKWRAALYAGSRCVASCYGDRPSDALIGLHAEILR